MEDCRTKDQLLKEVSLLRELENNLRNMLGHHNCHEGQIVDPIHHGCYFCEEGNPYPTLPDSHAEDCPQKDVLQMLVLIKDYDRWNAH